MLTEIHPNFPKEGVTFCDILPVLRDPLAFETLITNLLNHIFTVTLPKLRAEAASPEETKKVRIDAVVGLDARGFLFGPQIAQRLGAAFLPVRKRGKLPGTNVQAEYVKEYGTVSETWSKGWMYAPRRLTDPSLVPAPPLCQDIFEMPSRKLVDPVTGAPQNVIIVDDLIATGGSAAAAGELVRKVGGKTVEYQFVVAIPFLKGEEKLDAPSYQ